MTETTPPASSNTDLPRLPQAFDLGGVLMAAFRDPNALRKFAIGAVAAVLVPFFGIGLAALLGFMARTARNAMAGDEHPLAEWNDVGGLLLDGVRVLGVALLCAVAAVAVAGVPLALFAAFGAILTSFSSHMTGLMVGLGFIAAFGGLLAIGIAVAGGLAGHMAFHAGVMRMVAAGRFGEALRLDAVYAMVRANLGVSLCLILSVVIIKALSLLSLPTFVGVLPALFWVFASYGTAVGRAGSAMGLTVSDSTD